MCDSIKPLDSARQARSWSPCLPAKAIAQHAIDEQRGGEHAAGEEKGGDGIPLPVADVLQMLIAPKRRGDRKPSQAVPIDLSEDQPGSKSEQSEQRPAEPGCSLAER